MIDAISKRVEDARSTIEGVLIGLTRGRGAQPIDFSTPAGDPGLFGPDSITWRVHADFPSMLAGGISALLLQSLHPLAMAGVYDHSAFREDPLGRLRRTATYVAGTTYGSTAVAEDLVRMVRHVHERVVGTAPDGRRYSASDPDLLTWVHTAEVASFLRSFRRYARPLSTAQQDRYFAENARLAERLGARRVPKSAREVRSYFRRMERELVFGAQAKEAVDFLLHAPLGTFAMQPGIRLFFAAAIDLLPGFAQRIMGITRVPLVDPLIVRPALFAAAALLRWSIRGGTAELARRRVTAGRRAPHSRQVSSPRSSTAPRRH